MSPQSSVAFHPAVIIVVLRWYASNKLMFGAMPRKIPGVWGQSPQGAWDRIRKLSDFRIGSLAFPLDGRFSTGALAGGVRGGGDERPRVRLLGCNGHTWPLMQYRLVDPHRLAFNQARRADTTSAGGGNHRSGRSYSQNNSPPSHALGIFESTRKRALC